MSATGNVPARGRRHSIAAVTEARRLAREGGWSDVEIGRILLREGLVDAPVAKSTLGRWVRPEREFSARLDTDRAHGRRAAARGAAPMGPRNARPEFKLARMRALRDEVRLKDGEIARQMAFDFGDVMSRDMVAYALATGRYPRSLR